MASRSQNRPKIGLKYAILAKNAEKMTILDPFKGVGGFSGRFLKLNSVKRAFQYEVSTFFGMKIG